MNIFQYPVVIGIFLISLSLSSQVNFNTPVIIDANYGTRDVVVDDANSDNILDLITLGNSSDDISVHNGLGNLTYSSPWTYNTTESPQRMVSGDFNGDGLNDLAITSSIDDVMTIMVNNGFGAFYSLGNMAAGNTPIGITANDFNNDNILDLAVAVDLGDEKVVYLGNGDGYFQAGLVSFGGDRPQGIVSADIDGDTFIDLIVSNRNDDEIGVFLGNGDGTFGTITSYAVGGDVPEYLHLADMNGDGFLDVVTSNLYSDNVSVLLGDGTGAFGTAAVYTVPDSPKGFTITDLNQDGINDVAVACEIDDSFSVLTGNGDGTLNAAITFAAGNGAYNVVHKDMDGDLVQDLIVVNRSSGGDAYIFINQYCPVLSLLGVNTTTIDGDDGEATVTISGGTPPYEILWDDPLSQTTETATGLSLGLYTVTISDDGGCIVEASIEITNPVCDFDIDIAIDVLPNIGSSDGQLTATLTGGTSPFTISWDTPGSDDQLTVDGIPMGVYSITVEDGIGCPSLESIYLMEASSFCDSSYFNTRMEEIYFEDLNNDQIDEFIGLNPWADNAILYDGEGDGEYTFTSVYHTGEYTQNAALADFNGDSIIDIIATAPDGVNNGLAILFGNGDGTFQAAIDDFVGSRPFDIEHDDIDGDGDLDLLVCREQGYDVSIQLNNGSGSFFGGGTIDTGISPRHMIKGDFNEDGLMDFAVSNAGQWHLSIILGNGTSSPSYGDEVSTVFHPLDIITVDVDGDSHLDLITIHDDNDRLAVFLGNGDGTFQTSLLFDTPEQPIALSSGDYNNDGFVDIATANRNGLSVAVFPGSGNGEFEIYQTWDFIRPIEIVTEDIDDDGDDDLVFALDTYVAPDQVILFENCYFHGPDCVGDFNDDGTIDTVDLLFFLADFGCTSNCSADMNGDDNVNAADLLTFLSVFSTSCE